MAKDIVGERNSQDSDSFGSLGQSFAELLRRRRGFARAKTRQEREDEELATIRTRAMNEEATTTETLAEPFDTSSEYGRHNRHVRRGKILMAAVLVTAAAAATCLTFFLSKRNQEKSFHSKFGVYSIELVRASRQSALNIFQAIGSLSFSITSHAQDTGQSFPLVTNPHFESLGDYAVQLSRSVFVSYSPLIDSNSQQDIDEWNEYSVQHQGWLKDTLEAKGSDNLSHMDPVYGSMYYVNSSYQNTIGAAVEESFVDHKAGSGAPMHKYAVPVWQVAPASQGITTFINLELNSYSQVHRYLQGMKETGEPVLSAVAPRGNAKDHLEHIRGCHNFISQTPKLLPEEGAQDFPHTMMFQPVFNHTSDIHIDHACGKTKGSPQKVVGMVMAVFPWDEFFAAFVSESSEEVESAVIVADDQCGKQFSFRVDGSYVSFLGHGDLHDSQFDHMVVKTSFDENETVDNAPSCQYELYIYPTGEFHRTCVNDEPILYAVVVILIFTMTGVVFVLFVITVERRASTGKRLWLRHQAKSNTERNALIAQNASRVADAERNLYDYIIHEVRNPLSAAMSATNFVSSAVNQPEATFCMNKEENIKAVREDVRVIDSSLQFANEMLRTMLDMHRSAGDGLKVEFNPTNLLRDVLEPVAAMIYQRGGDLQVECICPDNLTVLSDKLRLKQMVLNLAQKAIKCTTQGFVRLRACVPEETDLVEIWIEDSGADELERSRREGRSRQGSMSSHGSISSHGTLASSFSLESLNKSKGASLKLCKKISELMNCDLYKDDSFDSGIPGNPGSRVILNLNVPAMQEEPTTVCPEPLPADEPASVAFAEEEKEPIVVETAVDRPLPDSLKVLHVEDDLILRKLFARSFKQAVPGWELEAAESGEAALELCEKKEFDLIFMDQYMSTSGDRLLGTETVHILRDRGVTCKIYGLSANDVEQGFMEAGANGFILKPLTSKQEPLREKLKSLIFDGEEIV